MGQPRQDADRGRHPPPRHHLVDHDLDAESAPPLRGDGGEDLAAEGAQAGDRRQAQEEGVPEAPIVEDTAGEGGLAGEDRRRQRREVLRRDALDVGVEEDEDGGGRGGDAELQGAALVARLARRARRDDLGARR